MFPDLLRDDVFRLETRRLWLRWPRASDAAAITALASAREVAEMTATIPHPYPAGAAAEFILASRAKNLAGKAIILVLTRKARPDEAIGCISLRETAPGVAELGYWLGKPFWGQGLMTEAASALVALALDLCALETVAASALHGNRRSRRVLETCGFSPSGEAIIPAPARGATARVELFWRQRAPPDAKASDQAAAAIAGAP